ncbi:MAG: glycogen/starch synthase [Prevotellamassilia sp.]|nr:glycogen/starch synthase [Prevotellamassilia sp.]
MKKELLSPNYIFETSWEVCNKVGGIYTVLSSRAKTLKDNYQDQLVFIGPDLKQPTANVDFKEDAKLFPAWKKAAANFGVKCRIGRWMVPGEPVAVLVDFEPFFEQKNNIYAQAWELFSVDSIRAYGDYDEASMFSYAAARFAEAVVSNCIEQQAKVIYQAHEWMSGLGMLFLKKQLPRVATIFTTHATSIGRSIAGNNKQLYAYFEGYNGDQMARELHMDAKHSIEKQSALQADCFTTVSSFTDRECKQLLDKAADVVLPNGFENDFVPNRSAFTKVRREARKQILKVAGALTGCEMPDDTLIVSTSGRNDYRCKGFDVFLESMAQLRAQLNEANSEQQVLALIEVPCWLKGPRADLQDRLKSKQKATMPLPNPVITHDLHNLNDDRIVQEIWKLGLKNLPTDKVKVLLVPCYLEGNDGIFNMAYYHLLAANDLALYPSYYEPWGYTPLESCAFHTPCVTTDLSGFGQWVDNVLGHSGELKDGVCVIHRTDGNFYEVAQKMCAVVHEMLLLTTKERTEVRNKAAKLANKAQWKHFIKFYYQAYDFALNAVANA